jgi:Cupin
LGGTWRFSKGIDRHPATSSNFYCRSFYAPENRADFASLHWQAIAAEWTYVVKGNVRTTVISPNGEAAQDDFGPGDVWFFPKGHGHVLQGLGPGEAHFSSALIMDI